MPAPLTSRRLAGGLALTAALAGLAAAPPTFAATASVVNGQLRYVAGPGESNDLLIEELTATSYRVTDAVETMAVGTGCAIDPVSKVVICSPATIASVSVELKDRGDDAALEVDVPTTVRTGTGDDHVEGGSVKDVILGQGGRDTLYGRAGSDVLTGLGLLVGDDGDDTLTAVSSSTSINSLYGGAGNDTLKGSGTSDYLKPGLGADDVYGGAGIDNVAYSERTTRVLVSLDGVADDGAVGEGDDIADDVENAIGGQGDDLLEGSDQNNLIEGGLGNDVLEGNGGDDHLGATLSGNPGGIEPGADTLRGGDGSDRLSGGGGSDTLYGDTGVAGEDAPGDVDVVTYEDRRRPTDGITASLDAVRNDGDPDDLDPVAAGVQPESDFLGTDVEGIDGTSGNDTLTGNGQENQLNGLGGNDTLSGKGGEDRLAGAMAFTAGVYGPPAPAPAGGAVSDDDKLYGGGGEDLLQPGAGTDDLFGGEPGLLDRASLDTVDYSDRTSEVNVTLDGLANDGAPDSDGDPGNGAQPENDFVRSDVEGAIGGSARDFLIATLASQKNVLLGNSGSDMINGGPGNDLLDGGGVSASYYAGGQMDGGDEIRGGAGADTVSYRERQSGVTVTLDDDLANDGDSMENDWVVATGIDAVENVVGGAGNDTLKGNGGPNTLQGGPGYSGDALFGRDGADYLSGGWGLDKLNGEGGDDRLDARADRTGDTLSCGAGTADVALFDSFDVFAATPNDCERLNPTAAAAAAAAAPVSVAPLVRVERAARRAREQLRVERRAARSR